MRGLPESFGALRERPFRLLWIGQTTSAVGDSMTPVALTFAVLHATGSAGDLGLVFAAYTLAHAVFILAGGVWSDRLERRKVMLACDVIRAGTQATLAALVISGGAELWHFLALAVAVGSAESFFSPAATGLIPRTVSAERLQQANALISLVRSGSWIVGPAAAGVIVSTAGPGWVFAIDSATFVVSAAFLSVLRVPHAPLAEKQSFVADLVHGWRAVRARRWVWASLVAFGIGNMAWGAQGVLGPIVAEGELGGAWAWGVLATCGGVGGLLGGVFALRWRPARPLLASHAIVTVMGIYVLCFAVPLPLVALGLVAAATTATIVLGNTLWETVLQREIPPDVISRVSSYDWAVSLIFMPIGFALWGPVSEWIGIDPTLVVAGSVVILTKLTIPLVPEIRGLRRAEPLEAAPPAEAVNV